MTVTVIAAMVVAGAITTNTTKIQRPPAAASRQATAGIISMPRPQAEWLAKAIYFAEGGKRASRPYGLRGGTLAKCMARLDSEWREWLAAGHPSQDFVEWIGDCWCPVQLDDAEDAGHLNQNWKGNVRKLYVKISKEK